MLCEYRNTNEDVWGRTSGRASGLVVRCMRKRVRTTKSASDRRKLKCKVER